jgi:hypothetical protein
VIDLGEQHGPESRSPMGRASGGPTTRMSREVGLSATKREILSNTGMERGQAKAWR